MKIKKEIIPKNQIMVASDLSDNKNFNLMKPYISQDQFADFKKFTENFRNRLKNDAVITIENEFCFFSTFIRILALTSEGSNNASESICQNMFPLSHLQNLLENSKCCWILRKNILFFIYEVYLDTEKNFNEKSLTLIIEVNIYFFNNNSFNYKRLYKKMSNSFPKIIIIQIQQSCILFFISN